MRDETPIPEPCIVGHLSVRDLFAAAALAGFCADGKRIETNEERALAAYDLADAMMEERENG